MLDLFRRLAGPAPVPPTPGLQLALAALMMQLAEADGACTSDEAAAIERLLAIRFGLSPFEAARLRREGQAMEQGAADSVRFTRAIKEAVAVEDRAALLELLWAVALTDGARDAAEDRQMRLVTNLLGLTDVESAQARQRATAGR